MKQSGRLNMDIVVNTMNDRSRPMVLPGISPGISIAPQYPFSYYPIAGITSHTGNHPATAYLLTEQRVAHAYSVAVDTYSYSAPGFSFLTMTLVSIPQVNSLPRLLSRDYCRDFSHQSLIESISLSHDNSSRFLERNPAQIC
jgi:hypothetical protein